MKLIAGAAALLIALMTVAGCGGNPAGSQPCHEETNGVYYWKTVFAPDSAELAFIDGHDVGRIYLRMFDVTVNPDAGPDKTVPNASVRIDYDTYENLMQDSLSGKEFVPVVYVTLDALKRMEGDENELAGNIVSRLKNMVSYNGLPNVAEMQLDCDWTISTEPSYFKLCEEIKNHLKQEELPWRLSSTIRLHQLRRKAPPVDCGVLMVYNTGNFDDPDADNSIIDIKDIEPYLKHIPSYALHLDVAYPTYSWQLLFRKRQFLGLMNNVDIADTTAFTRVAPNRYVARRNIPCNNRVIRPGDMVREEQSAYPGISEVKERIESKLANRPHSNILYHLDSKNLSKYSYDEIDNLYSTAR